MLASLIMVITSVITPVSVAGTAIPVSLPTCELMSPLMAGQGDTWHALPCIAHTDHAFVIFAQPVKGEV